MLLQYEPTAEGPLALSAISANTHVYTEALRMLYTLPRWADIRLNITFSMSLLIVLSHPLLQTFSNIIYAI